MTVLQDLRLLALLFLRSSHSDDWLPQLFGSVQYFFVSTKSPFPLSLSSFFGRRWTCDKRWDRRKHTARVRSPHSLRLQTPLGSTAMEVTPSTSQTFDQLDTAKPVRQVVVCLVNNCHKARLGRAALATARSRWDHLCLRHISWSEVAFSNASPIGNVPIRISPLCGATFAFGPHVQR